MDYRPWMFIFLTVCSLLPIALRAQTDSTLTYEQAVNIALRENLQIQQQRNLLNVAQAERAQAYAQFAPSLSLEASGSRIYGRQFDQVADAVTNEASRLSGGFGASLNLFNGLRNVQQLRQSQASATAQVQTINQTQQDVVFSVSQQYLQVLLNQELLRIAQTNLEQQEELLESVKVFVEVGTQNIADQYNQEAETKRVALTVVEAENQLAISKAQLTRTLQIDPFGEWTFAEPNADIERMLVQDFDVKQAYNQAVVSRPDLQSQRSTIKANRYGVGVARSNYWPSLSLGYYLGSQYSTLLAPPIGEQLFSVNNVQVIGLDLSVPIFQNLRNRTLVQRQKQLVNNAQLDLEDLERNILEQLQTAAADYRAARERIVAATAQVRAAEKALEAQKERFRLGVGNILDLNLVNAAFVEAQANQVQANYTLIFQKTALDYFTGKLTPEQF